MQVKYFSISLPLTKRQCHSYVIQMSVGQMVFDKMTCNCILPLTCLQPSCSITSGRNTLEANRYTETGSARRCTDLTNITLGLELAKNLYADIHIMLSTQCAGEVTFQPVYCWPKYSATVMWSKCLLARGFLIKWCVTVFYPWRVCSPAVPSLLAEIPLRQTDIQKLDLPEGVLALPILHWVWS